MTITGAVSDAIQLLKIMPQEYEVFDGLDVDHHGIAATFAGHGKLLPVAALASSCAALPQRQS